MASARPRPFRSTTALQHLKKQDPALGRLIDKVGAYTVRVERLSSPFAALAESIMHQQITGKAAATIVRRFKEKLGEGESFPIPEAVLGASDETLRGVGLSGSKVRAMRDLAEKTLNGTVPALEALLAMEEDHIAERLTQIRGIGMWTVHMLLIFRLGRPDVLPASDYGIRKGFMHAFRGKELPSPKDIERRAEKWRPYRSVASWYLWRALELPRKPRPKPSPKPVAARSKSSKPRTRLTGKSS
jgi:3-methyladenine DNA glycosylase/8-oxoguanine DNA glycosylase